jgi:hypothetical protein
MLTIENSKEWGNKLYTFIYYRYLGEEPSGDDLY